MTKRLSLLLALVFGFFFLNTNVSYADADPIELAQQLKGTNVVVDDGATLGKAGAIKSELNGSKVAVVAINDSNTAVYNPYTVAQKILSETSGEFSTVILVNGSSGYYSFSVVSTNPSVGSNLTEVLNNALTENGGDSAAAILNSMSEITKAHTITSTETSSGGSNSIGETLITGGLSLVGILVLGVVGAVIIKKIQARGVNKKADITYKKLPPTIEKKLETFKHIIAKHRQAKNTALVGKLEDILLHSQELFKRLDRKGAEQSKRMAEVSYGDTLEKLNQALGEDYYLDIMSHPQLWDNASHRMSEVRDAVIATDNQIVQNIREVNAARDLTMKVALESLTRSMDRTDVNDMFNKPQESH